jgi:hypothetical protein
MAQRFDYHPNRPGWYEEAYNFSTVVGPVSNYPMAYVYAMFLTVSGAVLGRSTWINYAGELYPNHFVCLVGASGSHHKSTAMKNAVKTLGEERTVEGIYQPITSLTTSAGLLQILKNNFGTGLVTLEELADMTQKKRQDYAFDLMNRLVTLYDCPDVASNSTKVDPIVVEYPTLTLASASTPEWLRSSISNSDLLAGFGNRMTWVLGDPRPIKAWPMKIAMGNYSPRWGQLEKFRGEVILEERAMDMWNTWFYKFMDRQKKSSPFMQTMAERIPDKIVKAAIISAAWHNTHVLHEELLEGAIDWGDYLVDCLEKMLPSFGNAEERVLDTIRRGATTKGKLHAALKHEMDGDRLQRVLKSLDWLNQIVKIGDDYQVRDSRSFEVDTD